MAAEARGVLASGRTKAAEAWLASLEPAARRGDHRPASSLLLHTGVIDPVSQHGIGPQVIVNVGTDDQRGTSPMRTAGERSTIIDGQTITESEHDE